MTTVILQAKHEGCRGRSRPAGEREGCPLAINAPSFLLLLPLGGADREGCAPPACTIIVA